MAAVALTWAASVAHADAPAVEQGSLTQLRSVGGVKLGDIEYVPSESTPDPRIEAALLGELPDYRSCGGDGESSVRYLYSRADLNRDGAPETLVYLTGPETCGSGGCTLLIFRSTKAGLARMARLTLVRPPIVVSARTSRGWRDLVAYVSGGGARGAYHVLRYTGRAYPGNPSTAPAVAAGAALSGKAYFADEAKVAAAAPLLRSSGCVAATAGALTAESLGPLRIGLQGPQVVDVLGAPASKSKRVRSEVDALEHETWRYPKQGLTLDMAFPAEKGDPTVASVRIGAASGWKTQRGIGIGSSYDEVEKAYGREKNGAMSQPPITFAAGSGEEGLVFSFENARVSQVFLGQAGE